MEERLYNGLTLEEFIIRLNEINKEQELKEQSKIYDLKERFAKNIQDASTWEVNRFYENLLDLEKSRFESAIIWNIMEIIISGFELKKKGK